MRRRSIVVLAVLAVVVSMMAAAMAGNVAAEKVEGAEQGGRPLSTDLTGAAEAPGPGDPDGSGTARITLNAGQGKVCFALAVEGIAPATAAHIHVAPAGEPGPVVVGLEPPRDGESSGCVEDVDRELIKAILQDPAGYYVNVHNADFPGGALRGQLG